MKRQYANTGTITEESEDKNTSVRYTHKIETDDIKTNLSCSKCGNSAISSESKYCGKCGSALPILAEINRPLYQSSEEGDRTIQNPEQHRTERHQNLRQRIDEYKPAWDKNGVIQYETEYIAILQRKWGMQVEFIIAFDDLTKEGYRLMAIDEGKSGGDSSGGFTGGVNSYFYFQKINI